MYLHVHRLRSFVRNYRESSVLPRLVDIGFIRRLATNSRDEQTFEAQRLSKFGQI